MADSGRPLDAYHEALAAIVNENGPDRDPQEFLNRVMTLIVVHKSRKHRGRPTNAEIAQDIDAAIFTLTKAIKTISDDLVTPRLWLSDFYGDLGDLWTDEGGALAEKEGEAVLEIQRESVLAKRSLQKIVSHLEQQKANFPAKKGRPNADENRLVFAVGKLFQKHIGEPTAYESGPFCRVIRVVLDACGLKSADPSRPVASALAALRTRRASPTKSQE